MSIISLDGTIASSSATGTHAVPTLNAADLVTLVPGLDTVANLRVLPFRQIPSADLTMTDVALITLSLGDTGRLLDQIPESGFAGLVVETLGGGHVPSHLAPKLETIARQIPTI